jgi:hypothetical protein
MKIGVFEELLTADNKLLKELDSTDHDHQKILDIFAKRVNLYKDYFEKQHDPIIMAIIDLKNLVIQTSKHLIFV